MSLINLRPWQSEAVRKALAWLLETRTDRHFLINAAPGAGKTICASVIARHLLQANEIERVIVIAPRAQVVSQWADEFKTVTGRSMTKVTGAHGSIEAYGTDLCATWSAVQGLQDAFQQVCRASRTLVICDEHHHAAVEAAWGEKAGSAFADARFVLVLTGTPIRSDGKKPVWLAYDSLGAIRHPKAGTYTLSYGKAVDLGYCRPITFHRHEGRFSVALPDGDAIAVSGVNGPQRSPALKRIKGLERAVDFYRLACTPKYLPDGTPDVTSYQASMLSWGIEALNEVRHSIPNAGGLVIAPNIEVAQYMAALLEKLEQTPAFTKPLQSKPVLVHSGMPNAEELITAFRNSDRRWLVSVAMVSEGVDIKRLRVLVYLPHAQTELAFRQAMGRVVRNLREDDGSRAYVVMPTHQTLEQFARRVEREMSPAARKDSARAVVRTCPVCAAQNPRSSRACQACDVEFPPPPQPFTTCDDCGSLNPAHGQTCQVCNRSLRSPFTVTLNDALRFGVIVRGMDLDEEEVRLGIEGSAQIRANILASGDDMLIKLIRQLPEEAWGRLRKILSQD